MEYLIGVILALAVSLFATLVGFDRNRAFYPVVMIVIASYYALFALMGGSLPALTVECIAIAGFALVSVLGFKLNLWFVVGGVVCAWGLRFHSRSLDTKPRRARVVAGVLSYL